MRLPVPGAVVRRGAPSVHAHHVITRPCGSYRPFSGQASVNPNTNCRICASAPSSPLPLPSPSAPQLGRSAVTEGSLPELQVHTDHGRAVFNADFDSADEGRAPERSVCSL